MDSAPGFMMASVETYLSRKLAPQETCDALVRQLSLLFSITSDMADTANLGQFDEVFISLADRVDAEARGFLAVQLSVSVNAPHGIIRRLAGDVIEVARPILIHSPVLTDEDLVHVATAQGVAHMQAIAERNELAVEVSDILVHNGDDTVRRAVAANHGARISSRGFRRLSEQALGDERLGEVIGQRSDAPEIIVRFLLRRSGKKGDGSSRLGEAGAARPLESDARAMVPARSIDTWYGIYDFNAAESRIGALAEQGIRGETLLMRCVAEERFPEAVLVIARLAGLRVGTVIAWMTTEHPDSFLWMAKAIGLTARTVSSLFNIGPWRHLLDGRRRQEAVRLFHGLDPARASEMLHKWRVTPARLGPLQG